MRRRIVLRCAAVLMLIAVFGFSISQATSLPGDTDAQIAKNDKPAGGAKRHADAGHFQIVVGPTEEIALNLKPIDRFMNMETNVAQATGSNEHVGTVKRTAISYDTDLLSKTAFDKQQLSRFESELQWRLEPTPEAEVDFDSGECVASPSTNLVRDDVAERLEALANELDSAKKAEEAAALRTMSEKLRAEKRKEEWSEEKRNNQTFIFGGAVAGR